jgi:hypothetical protein
MANPVNGGVDRIARNATLRASAMRDANAEQLDKLLHDSLIYIHSSARLDGKRSYIESILSGRVAYKSFEESDVRFIEANSGTILRTGHMKTSVVVNGEPKVLNVAFIETWIGKGDDWRMLSWQSTPRVAPPAS